MDGGVADTTCCYTGLVTECDVNGHEAQGSPYHRVTGEILRNSVGALPFRVCQLIGGFVRR